MNNTNLKTSQKLNKNIQVFNKNIRKLNEGLKRANSLKMVFIRGIVAGLGSAIGVTLVGGIILGLLARTINSVEDVPVLNRVVDSMNIEEAIENGGK